MKIKYIFIIYLFVVYLTRSVTRIIQGDSGGNVITLGGDSIGHSELKSTCEHVSNSEWLRRYCY
jgi:hypothetical protein